MLYVLVDNAGGVAEWPYSIGQMRKDNPHTSFPMNMEFPMASSNGVVHEVVRDSRPPIDTGEVAVLDDAPVLDGEVWRIGWTVRPKSTSEIEAEREIAVLDRETFAARAVEAGFVTYVDAANYVNGVSLPASVTAVIDQQPEADRERIRFEVMTERQIRRNASLMVGLMVAFNTDEAGLDALFGIV